jgi:hypothetical protein
MIQYSATPMNFLRRRRLLDTRIRGTAGFELNAGQTAQGVIK